MVLERHPKKYKHLIKTMLTQLVMHEKLNTTKAKIRHLKPHAEKLLKLARKAEAGESSALNLLKGRVHTKEAQTKLLVDLMPRLKHISSGFVAVKNGHGRRKGDNAHMGIISLHVKQFKEFSEMLEENKNQMRSPVDIKAFSAKILLEQKEFYEKKIQQNPDKEQFFRKFISRLEFQQQLIGKTKKEPPKYSLLV